MNKKISQVIEKTATDFRIKHGLSTYDSINLKSLLLKLNVSTYFKPLSKDFSGMAIKTDADRFILINTSQNIARQNFTICHELYHLFIQENFSAETTYKVGQYNQFDPNELKADLFASFLLMPKDGILSMIPDEEIETHISLDTIVKLEQFFQVSRSAMLYRLKGLNFIRKPEYDKFSTLVIRSAIRRGFSDKLYLPSNQVEFISNYGDLANRLVENKKISEGDYFSLMMDIGVDILSNHNDNDNEDW